MSIVTFWSNGKEETGKTLSIAAIATYISIQHNYKVLIVSTGHKDQTLSNCFWKEQKIKRNFGLFGPNTNIETEDGVSGLVRAMKSKRLTADSIKNYTKPVLKDRLEILQGFKGNESEYEEVRATYMDIITLANNYYDLVLVDLDKELGKEISDTILKESNVIVANINQRLSSINKFAELREEETILKSQKTLILVGRYDKYSKYTIKNISRYLNEKNKVSAIPYNTLFFEACEEAEVIDLFFTLEKIKDNDDRNLFFLTEVKRTSDNIIYRIQDLAMRM